MTSLYRRGVCQSCGHGAASHADGCQVIVVAGPCPCSGYQAYQAAPRRPSPLEMILANRIERAGLPAPVTEYRFAAPERQWRLDFAWPALWIAAEVEGGVYTGGRHVRGAGYAADCQKYNAAILLGWQLYRFTSAMIEGGEAVATLKAALMAADICGVQRRGRA